MATPASSENAGNAPADSARERFASAVYRHELSGMRLALILRSGALALIAAWLFIGLREAAWFYVPLLILFVVTAAAAYAFKRRGFLPVWASLAFYAVDAALLTFVLLVPNPYMPGNYHWPVQMALRTGNFIYFFMLMALFALGSNSGRAILGAGLISVLAWTGGVVSIATLPSTLIDPPPALSGAAGILRYLDPNYVASVSRAQEVIVMVIVTAIAATMVFRSRALLARQIEAERSRTNLARYFPPTIVEQLAGHDDPFGEVREQQVGVLFADLVGFTEMVETARADEIVDGLRAFHRRMERLVFEHDGTLDKYLGDGIMATFGTPDTGPRDAWNALSCAVAMVREIDAWNARRTESGFPAVRLAVGAHYGEVVIGDVGTARRLEFAVLGDTVNVASRLEEATREIGCRVLVSDALVAAARREVGPEVEPAMAGFEKVAGHMLRGRTAPIDVWAFGRA